MSESVLEKRSVDEMRTAAAAWRHSSARASLWRTSTPNLTLYDRIDELIDEIERLRAEPR